MKIKPVVMDHLYTAHTSFVVDFELNYNIMFISGDSGVGKSAVFSFIEEAAVEDKRIKCFDYRSINDSYKSTVRNSKGKLFVIDNADILLDDNIRRYIAADPNNQYIIIGRNPTGLLLQQENIWCLESYKKEEKTVFTLKNMF